MKKKMLAVLLFLLDKNRNTYLTWGGITFFISALFHEQISLALGTPLVAGSAFLVLSLSSLATRPCGTPPRVGAIYACSEGKSRKFWLDTFVLWFGSLVCALVGLYLLSNLNVLNFSAASTLYIWGLTFSIAATCINVLPENLIDVLRRKGEPVVTTKSVLIIGPSGAGKTGSVACLAHAARQFEDNAHIKRLSVHSENSETTRLFDNAISILRRGGRYPHVANDRITNFLFSLDCTDHKEVIRKTTFEFVDGPGGAIFPDRDLGIEDIGNVEDRQAFHEEIINRAKAADGIILCVNVNIAKSQIDSIDSGLRNLFQQIRSHTTIKRFCIAFLQIDKYFVGEEHNAYRSALKADPVAIAQEHLTECLIRDIKSNLPGTEIVVGVGSMYGFIENGQANFDNSTGSLLLHQELADPIEAFRLWQPFQILDPYIFMATGVVNSLKKL